MFCLSVMKTAYLYLKDNISLQYVFFDRKISINKKATIRSQFLLPKSGCSYKYLINYFS